MSKEGNITAEFDSVFIKKVIKSRKSFVIWIPKDEAEYLNINERTFLRVGLKKLKKQEAKK